MSLKTKIWLQGLAAAAISGSANAIVVVIVDPLTFNPFVGGSWAKVGVVAAGSAFVGAMMFLSKSPLPQRID